MFYFFVAIYLLFFLLFKLKTILLNKKNLTPTSQNINNSNGSISYTVGQVFYQTYESSGGVLSTGVQIPLETLTLSTTENILLKFSAKVYPNPTVKDVYIKLENTKNSNLSYQLFTLNGKLIGQSKGVLNENTRISMKQLPANTYLLQIKSNNQILKTYKIIKNQ